MLETLTCRLCGGELQEYGGAYKCAHCGRTFVKKAEEDYAEKLKDILKEEKYEKVSAARQNLWSAMHEEYVNSSSCLEYARELKSLVPSDYYANFAETANGKGEEEISRFLNKSSKADMETYADAVLDFMIKSMTPGNLTAVCNYIDRAYPKASPEYAKYINLYEEEAEKVESGIYELTMPRDVFVAYSSKDIDKVLELTDCLEEQGISCFISMRNLRHGRGAADNYDRALQTAIDNCKTVVFISSRNSRSLACDALRKEIPYIRKTDTDGAPAEYRAVAYEKIPYKYKKDRVEYLLDDYANTAADKIVKQFFDGVEWCKTTEDVADRVITYLTAIPEPEETSGRQTQGLGNDDLQKIISAVSGDRETGTSIREKEKNVLSQVKRLISMNAFDEAEKNLIALEEEEIKLKGICSAAVYYYKILTEYKVANENELIDLLGKNSTNLKENNSFRIMASCDNCEERTRMLQVEQTIEKMFPYSTGLVYECKRKCAVVTSMGICKDAVLRIPPQYKGLPVQKISRAAFMNRKIIESVIIPESVETICEIAFMGCSYLKSIVLPKSLKWIQYGAFYECENLKKMYYSGSESGWPEIYFDAIWDGPNIYNIPNIKILFYSKSKPNRTGIFWHYDDNGKPVEW